MNDREIAFPDWERADKVHDWRNYINPALRELWPTFNVEQAKAIAENAQELADREIWD